VRKVGYIPLTTLIKLNTMKTETLTSKELQWMKENMKEVVSELRTKSELIKNFSHELEGYRRDRDKIGYELKFNELLKKEEEKLNGRKNK
jgi:hypothetical protein